MDYSIGDKIWNNNVSTSWSARLRTKRFSQFVELLGVDHNSSILDVGGTTDIWTGTGFEKNVTLLNLSFPKNIENGSVFNCIRGNALDMFMFEDKRFDIVYSNSVIEHVGSFENQKQFANEVQRVGKAYWVQTPNKHFPIEPHMLFPFFQYLPSELQKKIATKWRYSHFRKWEFDDQRIEKELAELRLLDRKELDILFQGGELYEEKICGIGKCLVAYRL